MRLPMQNGAVNKKETNHMADAFLAAGFKYFDTAYGYVNGLSEPAAAASISGRYSENRFLLANKLTNSYYSRKESIRPLFEQQLQRFGVYYFDFYPMRAQDKNI